jgi:hypothetical protein
MENRVSKKGLPHAHILFWTQIDTQDINAVDPVINARFPKNSSFFNDQGMVSDFRQLIGAYQIYHHSKRCRLPNRRCRFGYPQEIAGETRTRHHNYRFAWVAEEGNIVSHNPFVGILSSPSLSQSNPFRTVYRIRCQVLRKEF